jgi:hypothetical protein
VHQVELAFRYKERRAKLYVCEDCGNTTENPEEHLDHLQKFHPNSPALKRSYDRRIIKISSNNGTPNSNTRDNHNSSSNHDATISMSTNTNSSIDHSPFSPDSSPFNNDLCSKGNQIIYLFKS